MIGRREMLMGALALTAGSPAAGMAAALFLGLRFDVTRNGSLVGHHNVSFQTDGDTLVANVAVNIIVRFGPLVLFRYAHSVRETWRGNSFVSLDSDTNDDGKRYHVHAVRAPGQVVVESSVAPRAVFDPGTIPLTHWNIRCMERSLFNPQDGVPIDSTVQARGEEPVRLNDGGTVRAKHYSLVGRVALEDWYDAAGQWVALRSIGTDGSTIEYRRMT